MNISDSHTDFLTSIENKIDRENYVQQIVNWGVKNISCAVFTTEKMLQVKDIIQYAKELEILKEKYNTNLMLSIEDLGFIDNIQDLNQIIKLQPFSVTLTWNQANQFGGGAFSKLGLTDLGKSYVNILERNKILVDTAHMSRKSFWDFCKITCLPIFNSHSNIYSLKPHPRNLTDKQIEKIVKSNGYLGLTFYDQFVSNQHISSKDIAMQFDYLIKKFGYKNFGLGTDLYGVNTNNLPIDIKGYNQISAITKQLKLLGYNSKTMNQLLYKNFEDFLKRINKKYFKFYY